MNRFHWYAYGFLTCFFLFSVMQSFAGKTQRVHSEYDSPGNIKDEFNNVFLSLQPKEFDVEQATPTALNMNEGNVLFTSGTVKALVTKIGADRYYTYLTRIP